MPPITVGGVVAVHLPVLHAEAFGLSWHTWVQVEAPVGPASADGELQAKPVPQSVSTAQAAPAVRFPGALQSPNETPLPPREIKMMDPGP